MEENLRWVKTHCARMDHGGCGLLVGVADNRIVKVKGDPDGYLNRGYACPKALASPDRLTHPGRLKHPLMRTGERGAGDWKKISWEKALDIISQNFKRIRKESGARAVAFCQGMPKGQDHFVLIRLANIFGSPNVVAIQDVCHAPREISGIHTCGFYPVADFHHPSRLALLWGSNIVSTNEEGAICSLMLEQMKQGMEIIVVDPRKTPLAEKAKYWLQIKPGTDNALALAFLNVIIEQGLYDKNFVADWTHGFDDLARHVKRFTPEKMAEVTWVTADLIRAAAACYARSRPAAIQWGNPIEQNAHAFDSARALVCLMAVCGNLDVAGGNIQAAGPPLLSAGKFVRADLIPDKIKGMINAHHRTIPRMMTVPPAYFRNAVLDSEPYPVRGAYVQCANPLMSYADSRKTHHTLKQLDFLAVADIFMTPTAAMADVVLPSASHFEFNDIGHYGLGHGVVLARPKAVDPPAECWPDMKILNELGKLMTQPELWYENWEDLLASVLKPSGLTYDQFVEQGHLKGETRFKKYEVNGFRTPTKKVELSLSRAKKFGLPPLPGLKAFDPADNEQYPLVLSSAKDPYYLHSSYRWLERLRKKSPFPVAQIHPRTAKEHGIGDGDEVAIVTAHGEITQTAHLTARVHPKVVIAAYGWWFPEASAESQFDWRKSNYNMLTSAGELGREFGTPNLKGIGCRIQPK